VTLTLAENDSECWEFVPFRPDPGAATVDDKLLRREAMIQGLRRLDRGRSLPITRLGKVVTREISAQHPSASSDGTSIGVLGVSRPPAWSP
jgi:hypothetical protein